MYNKGVHSFIIMKKIEISIPDKDYDLLTRIAQDQKRRLSDLHYLAYAEGLGYLFCETDVTIKKLDSEFTEEEKKQIKINEKLEKEIEDFWHLSCEERKAKGYKQVREYMSNHEYDQETKKYSDGLIKPLTERIESYAFNTPIDEEVAK
jgi:hypothetical protein|tara:strand:- start:6330 stop:6776 length:447 start_codon:yes stop_codon:yes gene_type:complete